MNKHLDLYRSLNCHRVKYLVIGGTASIAYGVPRTTRDIDLLIEATLSNAERLLDALKDVRFGTAYLTTAELLIQHEVTIFEDYIRVDVLTQAKGIDFANVWECRKVIVIGGVNVKFLNLDDLIESKRAAGRPGDLEDVRILEYIRQQQLERGRR